MLTIFPKHYPNAPDAGNLLQGRRNGKYREIRFFFFTHYAVRKMKDFPMIFVLIG